MGFYSAWQLGEEEISFYTPYLAWKALLKKGHLSTETDLNGI